MSTISISDFSKWVERYRGVLEHQQFKNQARQLLKSHVQAFTPEQDAYFDRALNDLFRNKRTQVEFEPRLMALLRDQKEPIRIITYRGEHGRGEPLQSKLGSLSFGSKDVALTYALSPNDHRMTAEEPRIITAEITIRNPVEIDGDDPFIDGGQLVAMLGVERTWAIMEYLEDHLKNTDNFGELCDEYDVCDLSEMRNVTGDDLLERLYVDAYPVFDEQKFVDWFLEAGYDGVVHSGNGESAMELEYKVFDKAQVRVISVVPAEEGMFDLDLSAEPEHEPSRPRL